MKPKLLLQEVYKIINRCLQDRAKSKILIVIDNIDEICENNERQFVKFLTNIQENCPGVHFFMSSRGKTANLLKNIAVYVPFTSMDPNEAALMFMQISRRKVTPEEAI